ncbi:MAG TPA: hypothetical protein VHD91_01515 [Gaiellaceae bacterium]|nr:hypothetical protein [Gaiellaceae bacterium]
MLAAVVVGDATAKSKPKPGKAAKHHVVTKKKPAKKKPAKKKPAAPKFDARYDCAKVMPIATYESFFADWQGHVAYRDKVGYYPNPTGGSCGFEYVYTDGPGAGQPGAGNMTIEYGSAAAKGYNGFEHTAQIRGGQACPNGVPPASMGSDDPRHCGPVPVAGLGDKAFECFSYITVLKGNVWIVLAAGEGVDQNGQWISSATLPPTDKLEAAMKAILAKLP